MHWATHAIDPHLLGRSVDLVTRANEEIVRRQRINFNFSVWHCRCCRRCCATYERSKGRLTQRMHAARFLHVLAWLLRRQLEKPRAWQALPSEKGAAIPQHSNDIWSNGTRTLTNSLAVRARLRLSWQLRNSWAWCTCSSCRARCDSSSCNCTFRAVPARLCRNATFESSLSSVPSSAVVPCRR